jgi:hypothetical protein
MVVPIQIETAGEKLREDIKILKMMAVTRFFVAGVFSSIS